MKDYYPGCTANTNQLMAAALSGAATSYTGLTRAIPAFPPIVHLALAGVGVAAYCSGGTPNMDAATAKLAGAAIVGGMIVGA